MTHTVALIGLLQVIYLSHALLVSEFHQNSRRNTLQIACKAKETNEATDNVQSPSEDESQNSFDAYFNKLNFGYEMPQDMKAKNVLQPYPPKQVSSKRSTGKLNHLNSQSALCYPTETRLRGCQTLFTDSSKVILGNLNLQSLPCVTDGSCPYSQFKCNRGHVWKGVVGSPVCFHCPVCESARKVYGRKKEATSERLLKSLKLSAVNNGGILLSKDLLGSSKWNSDVSMRCREGHEWTGKAGNIILNKSGCIHCAILKKTHGEEEMHQTAEHFGGQFIGFVDSNGNIESSSVENSETEAVTISVRTRRALWRCNEGHVFNEIAGNIRRPPEGKRKCSWCKTCRKEGREFEWNPTSSEKELKRTKVSKVSRSTEVSTV